MIKRFSLCSQQDIKACCINSRANQEQLDLKLKISLKNKLASAIVDSLKHLDQVEIYRPWYVEVVTNLLPHSAPSQLPQPITG